MNLVILLYTTPTLGDGTIEHKGKVKHIARLSLLASGKTEDGQKRHIVIGHDKTHFVSTIYLNGLLHRVEHRVDHLQLFQLVAFISGEGQRHCLTLCSFAYIRRHGAMIGITHGNKIFFCSHVGRCVDDLVDNHSRTANIGDNQGVGTFFELGRHLQLVPIVFGHLLTNHSVGLSIYRHTNVASLCGIAITYVDIVVSTLCEFELMTKGGTSVGAHLHISHASKLGIVLCPPSRMCQCHILHALIVHILGLNDIGTYERLWLFRHGQRFCGQHVGHAVCGFSRTGDGEVKGGTMLHLNREGSCFFVVILSKTRSPDTAFRKTCVGLRRHTIDNNLVGLYSTGVVSVIVQIKIDVVSKLADMSTRKFAVGQFHFLASVVLQGNGGRGSFLFIQIGIGRIGHQLVAIAVHIEVASRHFRILGIEVVHLLGLRRALIGRLLQLHRNSLRNIVIETNDKGNSAITPSLLEIAKIVHPLAVTTIEWIALLIKSVVEASPSSILVFIVAAALVVLYSNLDITHHFLARRYI